MLLGIDVGGTFTDAVVLKEGAIFSSAKTPTTRARLLSGIETALDNALYNIDASKIKRVSLSTTIVTNTLIEGKEDKAALLLIPGPGVNVSSLMPAAPIILSGYTDHRGRKAAAPTQEEIEKAFKSLKTSFENNTRLVAIAGKFSVRNPELELNLAKQVKEFLNPDHITIGSEMSGTLNFLRRANSAYYNAAVWRVFQNFVKDISEALQKRGLNAPVHILKADGGTMPLDKAAKLPLEAIFTGPAASVLGVMALADLPGGEAVSLDIGGTTTDIALWQDKTALLAKDGAKVHNFPTVVRSFWLRSVGAGGDSYVRRENGELKIGPMRLGAAMALGGEHPTVFDAARYLGLSDYGDANKAKRAMSMLTLDNEPPDTVAEEIINKTAGIISQAISYMLTERQAAPVYKVEDIVNEKRFSPEKLIGVGGAAAALAGKVAEKLKIPFEIPKGAIMANAVGAAAATPTTYITLRADTAEGFYIAPELSIKNPLNKGGFTTKDAWALAEKHLRERAASLGIDEEAAGETERIYEEEFNVIRGFHTMGKIITCKLQIRPGILTTVKEREVKPDVKFS
jgi:N-methylhydantoinase A/oxoprolinase/acetone carboxylase beta subunit